LLNRPGKGIWEPETLSYFYAPFVQNLLKTYTDACVQITVSIGFHLDRPDNSEVESQIDDLTDKTEQALYRVKEEGRNQTFSVRY